MRLEKVLLYTNQLELERTFYTETLGCKIIGQNAHSFTVEIGWTELTFERSEEKHCYHYCFLIPANKLHQALEWMERRHRVVDIENGRKIQNFESWNADSFYFYDGSGNLAECIVRYDLSYQDPADFDFSKVLCVNEIGMPTADVNKINDQIEQDLGTKFWKGDLQRFGTNGDQEGLLLLPNYKLKDTWFPTSLKTKPEPFKAEIVQNGNKYAIEYKDEILKSISKEA